MRPGRGTGTNSDDGDGADRYRRGMPALDPALIRLGYDDTAAGWMAGLGLADGAAGRVARVDRGACLVLTGDGPVDASLRRSAGHVVTGDWVALVPGAPDGALHDRSVAAVAPRRSTILRADPFRTGEAQVLAANVDMVFVVHGLDRPIRPGRIERSLVLAWESGANPHLVLTKADMADDPAAAVDEASAMAPGVAVHVTSAVTGLGLDDLAASLGGTLTAALLGESGAGKSTLVNHLVGAEVQKTATVRPGDGKGRHTTTARHLIPLPGGGVLLDTPGLRQLGLWTGEEGLSAAFADIEALAAQCRFGDCGHSNEPGCAVLAAIDDGRLPARRLAGYAKLAREVEHQSGVVAEHERRRQGRQQQRLYRAVKEEKRRRR